MPITEGGASWECLSASWRKHRSSTKQGGYYDSEEYEYDDYEEEAPVSKIRAVAPAEEVSRIATCWPTNFADVASTMTRRASGSLTLPLGVCYGRGGTLNQISDDVLLMTPHSVRMEEHRSDERNSVD